MLPQVLKKYVFPAIRAIVVLPTEILASQVFSVFQTFTKGSIVKVFLMSKRHTLSAETKALIKTGKLVVIFVLLNEFGFVKTYSDGFI